MTLLRISDVIEGKHNTSILVCLYMRGRMSKTALSRAISSNPRMGQKIDNLVDMGFIEATPTGKRIDLDLTPLGTQVAESLCRIEEDVYGEVGDPGHIFAGDCFIGSDGSDYVKDGYVPCREPSGVTPDGPPDIRRIEAFCRGNRGQS